MFTPASKGRSLLKAKGYTALYGKISHNGQFLDDGIALCFRAPHSYTAQDVIELSCHGGVAVSQAVLSACLAAGARPAAPGEFSHRAVLNGRLSLTQAEALMELISTSSARGAAVAQTALQGGLQNQLEAMEEQLVQLAGHLAAWTDYPEEDVEELPRAQFSQTVEQVAKQLDGLLAGYRRGSLLRRGVPTVIVGSPNVGKSTLFNLLSGFQRAIVTPVAGTTRDVITEEITLGGVVLQLADTAGLHHTGDEVEREGIRRSYRQLQAAGLVIAVFDGSQPLAPADLDLATRCKGRPALGIINKSDLGTRISEGDLQPYFHRVLTCSAKDIKTQEMIETAVLHILQLEEMDTDAAMLVNQRQFTAAQTARQALADAEAALADGLGLDAAGVCLQDALRALAALTGKDASQAVLEEVFSKFCVGK